MKSTSSVLGRGKIFDIDAIACMQHAHKISSFSPIPLREQWHKQPLEDQLLFKIAFISICHQINWDYLQNKLYENLFSPRVSLLETIDGITSSTISSWLSDYPKKERVRAAERAKLIRNIATTVKAKFDGSPLKLYETLSTSTLQNKKFEEVMNSFEAYRKDPLKKKTNVLSHEITTEQIYTIPDLDFLEPAVDYHIMRIYLRTGRVIPKDESLFKYFKGTPNPRGYIVDQLRKTVSEAIKLTAHYANLNIAQINYIEWQLGRSTCTNENPRCQLPPPNDLPTSILSLFHGQCPFSEHCTAHTRIKEFIEFEEPLFVSTHY